MLRQWLPTAPSLVENADSNVLHIESADRASTRIGPTPQTVPFAWPASGSVSFKRRTANRTLNPTIRSSLDGWSTKSALFLNNAVKLPMYHESHALPRRQSNKSQGSAQLPSSQRFLFRHPRPNGNCGIAFVGSRSDEKQTTVSS
jgi:hypothetical protein